METIGLEINLNMVLVLEYGVKNLQNKSLSEHKEDISWLLDTRRLPVRASLLFKWMILAKIGFKIKMNAFSVGFFSIWRKITTDTHKLAQFIDGQIQIVENSLTTIDHVFISGEVIVNNIVIEFKLIKLNLMRHYDAKNLTLL